MECRVIRGFPFSRDGIVVEHAEGGSIVNIPDDLEPGLTAAGYTEKSVPDAPENTAIGPAPEDKAVATAPENKGRRKPPVRDQAPEA